MTPLGWLLPAALAAAPAGPSAPRASVNVQVSDEGRVLRGAATLEARGASSATRCTLLDDGRAPTDMHAGDNVWCCDLAFPGEGPWELTLRSEGGQQRGTLAAGALPGGPPLFLSLSRGALATRTDLGAAAPAGGAAPAGAAATTPAASPPTVSGNTPRVSPAAWVPLLALLGALLAPLLVLRRGRDRGALPLPDAGYLPRPVAPADLDGLLGGPLAGHRVVWLGAERPGVYPRPLACTPEEIVRDVERLAAIPGPPVSLVVADPDLLERGLRPPWADLRERVGGRFPVYAVGLPT